MADEPQSFPVQGAKLVDEFDIDSIQPSHHELRQEGPYVVCRTPGHKHGHYIGPDKELVKLADGSLTIRSV